MTSPAVVANRRSTILVIPVLAIAALLITMAVLMIVPPFGMAMLAGTVVATELSPLLALIALLWCLPAMRFLGGRRPLRAVVVSLLVLTAVTALTPYTEFAHAASRAVAQLGGGDDIRFSLLATLRGLPIDPAVQDHEVRYSASDGAPLVMHRYAMPSRAPQPIVVVVYGGAWRGGVSTNLASTSEAIASNGYGVVAIDYRHAPRFKWAAQLDDVRRSIAMIKDSASSWGLDSSRIALLGRSAGGHLAELAAYSPGAAPVKAVIAFYAPHDLVQGYRDQPSPDPIGVQQVIADFLGGTPESVPAAYRDASPVTYVRRGLPPTMLIYGRNDHVVKREFNREAGERMRQRGMRSIDVELPWAEHGFDMIPTGLGGQLSYAAMMRFLGQELREH